jgi:UDP-N-acetylmuramate dehydrogenase
MLLQSSVSLQAYNTFHIEVKAAFFAEIVQEADIHSLITSPEWASYPHLILGGGANMLFTQDYPGIVVKISLLGKEVIEETPSSVQIKVGAGEDRHETMMRMLAHDYVGGENMVLIPGQVGSAPVGNIGAYGKEAKDIITAVEYIDIRTGTKNILQNADCHFAYRESIFKQALKEQVIITAVIFNLSKNTPAYIPDTQYKDIQQAILAAGKDANTISASEVAELIIEIRRHKLPDWTQIGTAGSFFKNPVIDKLQYEKLVKTYPNLIGWEVKESLVVTPTSNEPSEIYNSKFKIQNPIKLSAGQLIELAGMK